MSSTYLAEPRREGSARFLCGSPEVLRDGLAHGWPPTRRSGSPSARLPRAPSGGVAHRCPGPSPTLRATGRTRPPGRGTGHPRRPSSSLAYAIRRGSTPAMRNLSGVRESVAASRSRTMSHCRSTSSRLEDDPRAPRPVALPELSVRMTVNPCFLRASADAGSTPGTCRCRSRDPRSPAACCPAR